MGGKIIGIVLPNVPGYSETFFNSKIDGLIKRGHRVVVFVGKGSLNGNFKVIKSWPISKNKSLQSLYMLICLPILLLRVPEIFFRFIKLERETQSYSSIFKRIYINGHILSQKLDWLHFGFATMSLHRENVAAAIKARMAVSIRGFDIAIYPLKHPDCYKLLWEKVDKVHSISADLEKTARNSGLSDSIPVVKITPAIDTSLFTFDSSDLKEDNSIKILTVGRLHWKKGFEYALQAMKYLRDRGIDFEYAIIGDGSEYERLSYAIHQLGLNDYVRFLGKKTPGEIAVLMRNYSLYLQPSVQEGFCNSVLEAQASGMLCIVTDAEGLPENVLHEKTGWVVKKRRPKEWAERIIEVHNLCQSDKNRIREAASSRVKAEFNISQYQEKFNNFYT